ncbi:dipeptidase [Halalkalibacter nanhaiisediminis]|uniref:Membrane dipeptidase n=1 Tax=Halalkalibacter nanhaiisediminis TaxID=688079 RepID=A0A562QSU0_9BACI|nr:dipeptidase [Halalkalibacter nanhaiisediminis]TWI59250.1 membrane dipeptidase [Halalkalibacter nanhaiisediminis]
MKRAIIDTHCDALLKLWEQPARHYRNSEDIDTNLERLQAGNVKVQLFAIFVEPWIKQEQKFQVVLDQINLFFDKVVAINPFIRHIKKWSELDTLKEHEIGAVLTLEGVDAIGDDLTKLAILNQLGVLSVGLTWNQANLCADGVGEPRGAGLSLLGKEVVRLNNENNVLTDVSHLSISGFWDVIELADFPIASHSNARALCDHPRNLYNEQIEALVKKDGFIGIVFHPLFLTTVKQATITDILRHLDHMCSLGAQKHIGFGSDFDGISTYVENLRHSGQYDNLVNELEKHYSTSIVEGFLCENFIRHLPS